MTTLIDILDDFILHPEDLEKLVHEPGSFLKAPKTTDLNYPRHPVARRSNTFICL
jgi:hypothetical protein